MFARPWRGAGPRRDCPSITKESRNAEISRSPPEGSAWREPLALGDDEMSIVADLAAHGMPLDALRRDLEFFLGEMKELDATQGPGGAAGVTFIADQAKRFRRKLAEAIEMAVALGQALAATHEATRGRLDVLGWDDKRLRAAAESIDLAMGALVVQVERRTDFLADLEALPDMQADMIERQQPLKTHKRECALSLVHRLSERWEAVHGEKPRRKAFVPEREKRSDGTPRRVSADETVSPAAFGLFIDRLCALRAMAPLAEHLGNDFALAQMLRELDENAARVRAVRAVAKT
jgi:hypothetical protein